MVQIVRPDVYIRKTFAAICRHLTCAVALIENNLCFRLHSVFLKYFSSLSRAVYDQFAPLAIVRNGIEMGECNRSICIPSPKRGPDYGDKLKRPNANVGETQIHIFIRKQRDDTL